MMRGGVIDDLIAYWLDDDFFRLVVNAGTRDKDMAWIGAHAERLDVKLLERRDLAMLAVQGPQARERMRALLSSEARAATAMALRPFFGAQLGEWFVARTGYTGEDGFEIMLPASEAGIGMAAAQRRRRALLRPGRARYAAAGSGHEPVRQRHGRADSSARVRTGWTVAFEPRERDFIGRAALEAIRARGSEQQAGRTGAR